MQFYAFAIHNYFDQRRYHCRQNASPNIGPRNIFESFFDLTDCGQLVYISHFCPKRQGVILVECLSDETSYGSPSSLTSKNLKKADVPSSQIQWTLNFSLRHMLTPRMNQKLYTFRAYTGLWIISAAHAWISSWTRSELFIGLWIFSEHTPNSDININQRLCSRVQSIHWTSPDGGGGGVILIMIKW